MRAWPIFAIAVIVIALAMGKCGDRTSDSAPLTTPPSLTIPDNAELRWLFTVERRNRDRFVIPGRSLRIVDQDGHGHRVRMRDRPTVHIARGDRLLDLGTIRPG